jgi:DNA repair protein RadA/Sms
VFVSVAGGIRVDEPGADLAVALAIASAAKGIALGDGRRPLAAFGEIGLTGEVRHVAHPDRRLAEAKKFGLDAVVGPDARTLREAIRHAFASAADAGAADAGIPDAPADVREAA